MSDKTFGEKIQDFGETVKRTILGEEESADMKAHSAIVRAECAKEEAEDRINEASYEAKERINEEGYSEKRQVDEHSRRLKESLESHGY